MSSRTQVGSIGNGQKVTNVAGKPAVAIYVRVNPKGLLVGFDAMHDVMLMNIATGELTTVAPETTGDPFSPRDQWKAGMADMNNKPERTKKENATMSKFDLDTDGVVGNAMSTAKNMKDTVVMAKKGDIVISTIKSSLKQIPGLPPMAAMFIDSPYADMVIGLALSVAVPALSDSKIINDAAKAANFAGSLAVADKLGFIEKTVETLIGAIPGLMAEKTAEPTTLAEAMDPNK